ncbi:MAG: hypothetical protein GX369_01130 [Euryarchaeota archaeon]|nr:hypothetical protein [Euryarchaeota archaeon]
MDNLLVIFVIIAFIIGYVFLMTYLERRKVLERYNMSSWYGFIMWRTLRGQKLVDFLASPKRFWRIYATISKAVCLIVMMAIMALLLWEATLVTQIPADQAPTLDMLVGLPGINPLIPLWYGILALAIGVAVHEIGHGIITRVAGMNIKSMGILLFIFPVGAFVEPDENALFKSSKKVRTGVFAAGPATNIFLALFCAFMFSTVMVGSAEVASEGPVLTTIYENTPSDIAGLKSGYQIISINGEPISYNDLNYLEYAPGSKINLTYLSDGNEYTTESFAGIVILSTNKGLPAADSGLEPGMIIKSIDGEIIRNEFEFRDTLSKLRPGGSYEISALVYDVEFDSYIPSEIVKSITPANRADYIGDEEIAYLGVTSLYLGANIMDPQIVLSRMTNPYTGAESVGDYISGTLMYIALPFSGLQPLDGPYRDIFVPGGIFSGWNNDAFWITANCFYWIFWISLMLGMTNALPAIPLDGGHLFRDWVDTLVRRFKKNISEDEVERIVSAISTTFIVLVVFLIAWLLIGPRLM